MTSSTRTSDASQLAPGLVAAGPETGASDAPADQRIGELLDGRYRLLERLAEGGMGTVYRAEHVALRKEVAIKFVQNGENPDHAMRFLREAMLTSRIDHPNVISALDYSTFDQAAPYLVMSLVEGPTLANVMRFAGPMSWLRAAQIGAQIADAVDAAHAQGIVHRDLKPENVVLQPMADGSEVVKVLDFGLAKYARDSLAPPQVQGAQRVTRRGVVVGTPGYMAPEQAVGMRADHKVDLYALGVLLWECVAGRRLWDSDDIQQLLTTQLSKRPKSLREERTDPSIPEAFDAIVAELLVARPEKRADSAAEIRDRLRALVEAERRELSLPIAAASSVTKSVPAPPPDTDTVFIHNALAGWNAGARAARAEAPPPAAGEPTTQVLVSVPSAPIATPAPTQAGFRAARMPPPGVAAPSAGPANVALPSAAQDEVAALADLAPPLEIATQASALPSAGPAPLTTSSVPAVATEPAARVEREPRKRWPYAAPLALMLVVVSLWVASGEEAPAARAPAARTSQPTASERGTVSAVKPTPATAVQTAASGAPTPQPSGAARASASSKSTARTPAAKKKPLAVVAPASATAKQDAAPSPVRAANPEQAGALRAKARGYFRNAEFALAAQTYRQAIDAAPGHAGAYSGLGASQLAVGDARAAVASYKQAIKRSPGTSGFYAALGRAYLMLADRERAIAEYRKAIALDPANQIASDALARLTL